MIVNYKVMTGTERFSRDELVTISSNTKIKDQKIKLA